MKLETYRNNHDSKLQYQMKLSHCIQESERGNDSCTFEKNDPHNSGALYHLVAT